MKGENDIPVLAVHWQGHSRATQPPAEQEQSQTNFHISRRQWNESENSALIRDREMWRTFPKFI